MVKARTRPIDRGTDETQARRRYLAGEGLDCPLGTLHAHSEITEAQYEAGCRYAWLYALFRGPVGATAARYGEKVSRKEWPEDKLVEFNSEFTAMTKRLNLLGSRGKNNLDNLVVFGKTPRWMQPVFSGREDEAKGMEIKIALDELAMVAGYKSERK